jgi:hypothetical protein
MYMSIVKLSPAEVLTYVSGFVTDAPGSNSGAIYELTPMGHNEYFVHIYTRDGGLAPTTVDPVQYNQIQRYAAADESGTLRRFGLPSFERLFRITYRSHTQDFVITSLEFEARHRYDIGGPILALLRCVSEEEGAALLKAALGCKVVADKAYQPAEILDVLHRMHLARHPEALSNSFAFIDLDDTEAVMTSVGQFPFDKSQEA